MEYYKALRMFRPLSLYIGTRYSLVKHKNKFISFISLASILGIALGVMALIVGLSAMNGFEKALRDQLLSVVPHAELSMVSGSFKHLQNDLIIVENSDGVDAASAFIKLDVLLENNNKMQALQVRAITPETEGNVTHIERFIQQGGWELLNKDKYTIILGKTVAQKLALKVGDPLLLLLPQSGANNRLKSPRKIRFTLVGLFAMGGQLDSKLAFIHIDNAKKILGLSSANAIAFKVHNILDAQKISRQVAYKLNEYLYINSWITSQGSFYQDIKMVKTLMYIVLLLVISVACFNIISTLVMAVNDKRADIAILKTMGASKWMLRFIFIVQGAFNGLMGTFIGVSSGVYLALNLTHMIKVLESLIGHKFLSGDIYFIDFLPSEVIYSQVIYIAILAFSMSVIATLYPAWRASEILPAQELGYAH